VTGDAERWEKSCVSFGRGHAPPGCRGRQALAASVSRARDGARPAALEAPQPGRPTHASPEPAGVSNAIRDLLALEIDRLRCASRSAGYGLTYMRCLVVVGGIDGALPEARRKSPNGARRLADRRVGDGLRTDRSRPMYASATLSMGVAWRPGVSLYFLRPSTSFRYSRHRSSRWCNHIESDACEYRSNRQSIGRPLFAGVAR